jgi:hypothetical protein
MPLGLLVGSHQGGPKTSSAFSIQPVTASREVPEDSAFVDHRTGDGRRLIASGS